MNPALEGANLYAYGHSFLAGEVDGQTPGQRYVNRLARRNGMTVTNRAVSGSRMEEIARRVLQTWQPGSPGVVLVDGATNNVLGHGPGAAAVRGYRNALRALAWYLRCDLVLEDTHPGVYRTGGATNAHPDSSGGTNWTLAKDAPGQAQLGVQGFDRRIALGFTALQANGVAGAFDVLVNGQVEQVVHLGDQTAIPGGTTPKVVTVQGSGGDQVITVRRAGGASTGLPGPFLDWVGFESATPPMLGLVTCVPPAAGVLPNDAEWLDPYNQAITDVAAELGHHVFVSDPRAGFDPAWMISPDRVHLSALGHAHHAETIDADLQRLTWERGVTR